MDFDKLFKEYCLKQNPSETVSGDCAMFVLGFVDFLKEQAVEHGVQADANYCECKMKWEVFETSRGKICSGCNRLRR